MSDALHQTEALARARVDIARLETAVEGQGREIGELKEAIETLAAEVKAMRLQLAEARGGWKTLLLVGGAGATLLSAGQWLVEHLIGKHP